MHSGWQEKLTEKLWQQGSLPLTTINMEVLFLLAFHNLQGWHHNDWKKKEQKDFVTIMITNTWKVINVMRRNYLTLIVKRRKKMNKKHRKKRIYTRNQPQRKKKWIWPYVVKHWQESPLKLSRYKDISRRKMLKKWKIASSIKKWIQTYLVMHWKKLRLLKLSR